MARRPNYQFERNARARAKAAKREAKRLAKQAAKDAKTGGQEPTEDGGGETPDAESLEGADPSRPGDQPNDQTGS